MLAAPNPISMSRALWAEQSLFPASLSWRQEVLLSGGSSSDGCGRDHRVLKPWGGVLGGAFSNRLWHGPLGHWSREECTQSGEETSDLIMIMTTAHYTAIQGFNWRRP